MNSVGVGRELMERFGDRPEADRQLFRVNAIGAAEVRGRDQRSMIIEGINDQSLLSPKFLSAVLPPMERCGGGLVVVLSSSQGFRPIPLLAAYSATKVFVSKITFRPKVRFLPHSPSSPFWPRRWTASMQACGCNVCARPWWPPK